MDQITTQVTALPGEIVALALSTILLFVQIILQANLMTRERGVDWNMGARDGTPTPLSNRASRADRALANFKESYPAFIALALALVVVGRDGGIGAIGAWLWLAARIVYVPLYLAGTPYVRTACWMASIVGLGLMLIRLL